MFTEEEFLKLHTATHGNPTLELPNDRAARADQRAEALDLVLICAQDIVDAWPELTMRKLGEMTKRVDTLRQALEATRK